MTKKLYIFISLILFIMNACTPASDEKTSTTAPQDHTSASHPEGNTDCAYCGMPSSAFPEWQVQLSTSASHKYFCSPRCMLLTVKNPETKPEGIEKILVADFYETKRINAQNAFFVTGSDVLGPMGHDLIPLQDEESAREFLKDHQGKKMYRFEELTLDIIKKAIQP